MVLCWVGLTILWVKLGRVHDQLIQHWWRSVRCAFPFHGLAEKTLGGRAVWVQMSRCWFVGGCIIKALVLCRTLLPRNWGMWDGYELSIKIDLCTWHGITKRELLRYKKRHIGATSPMGLLRNSCNTDPLQHNFNIAEKNIKNQSDKCSNTTLRSNYRWCHLLTRKPVQKS
jgi:hypothetical protein